MAKNPTFPDLYDDALQMSITKLKEWGYLQPKQYFSTLLRWSRRGNETGSITIWVNTTVLPYRIELDYKYRDEPRKYTVTIISKPSNLGKGEIFYFVCPQTGKLCRKLYSIGGYFLHRDAFAGCYYESQTYSKKWREMDKVYAAHFNDSIYEQIYKKYLKKTYAGKPTKKYARLSAQLAKKEMLSSYELEKLILTK